MRAIASILLGAALVLTGCGAEDPEPLPPNVQSKCALAEGTGPRIGLAYGVGGRGDRGINDSAFRGVAKALKQYSATCIEDEAVEGESENARQDRLKRLSRSSDMVIAVGPSYSDAVNKVAQDRPRVRFAVIDGYDPDKTANSNVAYLRFAEEQGSFLVGVAAALTSKSHTVGFIGGVRDARTRRYEAGYTFGAKAGRPDVKVLVTYLKQAVDEDDPDAPNPKEAATDLFDRGADVVYQVGAGTGSSVFSAAVDADGWAIGSEYDQYQTANEDQRERILTSMVKRGDTVSYDFVKAYESGHPVVGAHTYGVKEHGVGFATSGGFVKTISAELDDYASQISRGDLKIPNR